MTISAYQRYCLNMQGYSGLRDDEKLKIDLAQRFKPAVCAAVAVVAVLTQSAVVALIGAGLGFWAALLPGHPVDLLYNLLLRPALKLPDLPADPMPRRFACGMAATLLLVGAILWLADADLLGTIFVGMTAASLLVLMVADFCLGSFFYWLLIRRRIFAGR